MSSLEMIKDLRELTQAGMNDCKKALEESNWDLQKAIDIIKTKGKLVAAGNKIAAEGRVVCTWLNDQQTACMVEVNCVTDFVANSPEFAEVCDLASKSLCAYANSNISWKPQEDDKLESARKNLLSTTKENIIIRRWWVEQAIAPNSTVCYYLHPNKTNAKIGVILTLMSNKELTKEVYELGNDLAMQVAAMAPLAVSPDRLDPELVARQKAIFQLQIDALNKPSASHAKIMEGKLNKWYTEVCLLNQESVIYPKVSVEQVIKNLGARLGVGITVINFIRCQVEEGIDKPVDNFADEAKKMAGVAEPATRSRMDD